MIILKLTKFNDILSIHPNVALKGIVYVQEDTHRDPGRTDSGDESDERLVIMEDEQTS